jgi:predicted RNase H-like HicB family nuclease
MKLLVTVDRDEDSVFVVECPAIPGCVSQGGAEAEGSSHLPVLSPAVK